MTTSNVVNMPQPGSPQNAGTFNQGFINPPILPPVSDAQGTLQAALLDQLAGYQISLFQHLFPIPQAPDYQKTTFGNYSSQEQMEAVLNDINNIKMTVVSLNQITNTAANRIPANASIDTNPNYAFLDNTVVDACNRIANDIIQQQSILTAQTDYTTLRNLLNPFYGY